MHSLLGTVGPIPDSIGPRRLPANRISVWYMHRDIGSILECQSQLT